MTDFYIDACKEGDFYLTKQLKISDKFGCDKQCPQKNIENILLKSLEITRIQNF